MRDQLRQLIENTPQPALVVGQDLTVLAANDATRVLLPAAAQPDGLKVMLPSCDPADCARRLERGERLVLTDPLLPNLCLELIPFEEEDGVVALGWLTDSQSKPQGPVRSDPTQAIAAFSHAYRNPLSDMFGMLGVIGGHLQAVMDDSCDSYLESLNQDCYQMLRGFSNLTELYKYYSGMYASLPEQPVDIWQLTRSLCESAAMLLKPMDIPLTFALPEAPCLVLCDQNRFATALSNLIANSCRFTREDNAIHITGKTVGGKVIITVADRGTGIPEEHLGRVLEPFFSYDPEGAPFAGLGIGLPLVNSFARAAGGSLALQSREMEGTVVALSLPIYDGELPPTSCRDAALLLSDRFSPLNVVLGTICRK